MKTAKADTLLTTTIKQQLDEALRLRAKQEFSAACVVYQQVLKQQPQHRGALLGLSTILRIQGEFTQALALLEKLQQYKPHNEQAFFQQGLVYRQQGKHPQAIQCFQQVILLAPSHSHALINLAAELFISGEVKPAIDALQQLLAVEPNNLSALLQIGDWLKGARENEAALVYFEKALAAHPAQLQPYLHLADALLNLGKTAESLDVLDQATQRLGERAAIYHKKAEILWWTRQLYAALATINAGLALFADDFNLQLQRIDYQIELGYFQLIEALIAKLPIHNFNQHIRANCLQAKYAQAQWQITKAIALFQAIMAEQPYCIVASKALRCLSLLVLNVSAAKNYAYSIAQYNIGFFKISGQQFDSHDAQYLQDHQAQIETDYALNEPTVQRLQQAVALPRKQRLTQLANLVREEPTVTATAISFLLALRQQHYFGAGNVTGNHAIAPNIFQFWDTEPPPKEVIAFTSTWQQHNPNYHYQRFNDSTASAFLQQYYSPEVLQSYQCAAHVAQKADILRLALLYEFGGVYADADDVCLKPLATLLPDRATLIFYQERFATVGNNFIAAQAKHPVLAMALNAAVSAVLSGDKQSIWLATGPGVISRALALYLAQHIEKHTPAELGIFVLSRAKLLRAVGIHGKLAYKGTNDSWLIKEFKNAQPLNFPELLP